jgi:hypothetical protein
MHSPYARLFTASFPGGFHDRLARRPRPVPASFVAPPVRSEHRTVHFVCSSVAISAPSAEKHIRQRVVGYVPRDSRAFEGIPIAIIESPNSPAVNAGFVIARYEARGTFVLWEQL